MGSCSLWKNRLFILIFFFFLISVLLCGGAGYYLLSPGGKKSHDRMFVVREGMTLRDVADKLASENIITRRQIFLICARLLGYGRHIKAGEYRLNLTMPPLVILDMLNRGEIVTYQVTIPEGFTRKQIALLLEQKGLVDRNEFLKLTGDPGVARGYGLSAPDLEGYLYPDTYRFSRGLSTKSVIDVLVQRFQEVIRPYRKRIKETGMTVEQVVILASIVEKETGRVNERPVIASVFLNRLRKGRRLESDPTVIYGLKNFDGNLTRMDLRTPSPYNTYLIHGLPPGAIANPGKEAIRAVLYPADTAYLYFVSKNDGSHCFSETLSAHNRAVRFYQKRRRSR